MSSETPEKRNLYCCNESKDVWLLVFADAERGHSCYSDGQEAKDAYARAKLNWTCALFVPVESAEARVREAKDQVREDAAEELVDLGYPELAKAIRALKSSPTKS